MNTPTVHRRTLFAWAALALMVGLLCVLAVLQYRWIGQISEAAQQKLQESLRTALAEVSREFDANFNSWLAALVPSPADIDLLGREHAYSSRYKSWKASGGDSRVFRTVALAWNEGGRSAFRTVDPATGEFAPAPWPPAWTPMKDWVESRALPPGTRPGPRPRAVPNLIDMPRFGDTPGGAAEQDWLLLEMDPSATAASVLPALLSKYLGAGYAAEYEVQVTARGDPSQVLYHSDSASAAVLMDDPDASVNLSEGLQGPRDGGGPGKGGQRPKGPKNKDGRKARPGPPPRDRDNGGPGQWQLSIKMKGGSLESYVAQARRRNLAVSGGVLVLLLATVLVLVQFTRQSQRLADMQMEFVAGVSHELRTPLTVIRTAAYNLRGKLSGNPRQVEQYGALIQQESEKLTALVEQVMEFSRTRSGNVLRERQPVSVEQLVEQSFDASKSVLEQAACGVERDVAPDLPPVMGDAVALRQAVHNLINNAVKYGGSPGNGAWIGLRARAVTTPLGPSVEIRVADRGPGIPLDEQSQIFDPFFRGRKAVEDQIHGTGLGLNLVKRIVEAHGGTVSVESQPGTGTTFVVTIPAGDRA